MNRYLLNSLIIFLFTGITQAENYLNLDAYQPTTDWQFVASAALDPEQPNTLILTDGQPHLLNNGPTKNLEAGYLITQKKFADHEVHVEFMIPKGSNSGFYLMGRYEIQVLDSHGATRLFAGHMGGLYARWDPSRKKDNKSASYDGKPPRVNAAKPHGQWQQLTIKFRAPRFNSNGKKIAHAHFIEVILNGQTVQKNIDATGPTRSHPLQGEAAKGPLAIQGDHGPIVIRKLEIIDRDFSPSPSP
ncbi:MAG: DUF1080 domain-containing protein [Verrucomicrobiae bacterium]|nr:DUF1080 domain-containing protein [Verrucomicrobiae bacterium]NNJ42893.1 DUF1080 domain-containing protein [Akkermansiaceae bacterium]